MRTRQDRRWQVMRCNTPHSSAACSLLLLRKEPLLQQARCHRLYLATPPDRSVKALAGLVQRPKLIWQPVRALAYLRCQAYDEGLLLLRAIVGARPFIS